MNQDTPDTNDLPVPGDLKTPNQELCGEFDIRIDRDGTWFYHDSPIGRMELVKLFSTVLSLDENGNYWLTTPVERGQIAVEDVPFMAVEMNTVHMDRHPAITMRTNLDEIVTIDDEHPLDVVVDVETGEPSPYITVRKNLRARLTRAVFYELVEHGTEEEIGGETLFGVWSAGIFFPIGKTEDPGGKTEDT